MGCNCNRKKPDVSLNVLSQQDIAASCQLCPKSKKDENGNAIICSISKKQIVTLAREPKPKCPIGTFFAEKQEIRWLGIDWLGIPYIQRFKLTWMLKRRPVGLSGCGCIKSLKEKSTNKTFEGFTDALSEGLEALLLRFGDFSKDYKSIFN